MGNRWKSVVGTIILLASAARAPLYGQSPNAASPTGVKYEVISVKPSPEETQRFNAHFTPTGFSAKNITPLMVMRLAFGLINSNDDLFHNVPAWAQSERFDIEARVGDADVEKYGKLSRPQQVEILQTMLADSFHLIAVRGVQEGKVYLLLPAKGGTKIKSSDAATPPSPADLSRGHIIGHDMLMQSFVSLLTQKFGTTVVNKTGLTGRYDIALKWDPTADQPSTTGDGTTLQAALKEQLGLRVESGSGPVEILTVQRMDRPAEN